MPTVPKMPANFFYVYRDHAPKQGKYKGVVLDTFEKAKEFIDWQRDTGLITKEEKLDAYRVISHEFDRMDLTHA